MMYYLFEDNRDDALSKLFMAAYPEDVRNKFIYVGGSSKLFGKADELLNLGETVAVYMDMPPGNTDIRKIYEKLLKLSRKPENVGRMFLFPIICAEFYFIKSLMGSGHIIENDDVSICVNKLDFTKSSIYNDPVKSKRCTGFEPYCKLILLNYVDDCIKHSRNVDGSNARYGKYYEEPCLCSIPMCKCNKSISLIHKSIKLLMQYDCVPSGSVAKEKVSFDLEAVNKIRLKLVDAYNKFSDYYSSNNVHMKRNPNIKYRHIKA